MKALQSGCPTASRSALELVQHESDALAASLVRRGLKVHDELHSEYNDINTDDIWEALCTDASLNWLAEQLQLRSGVSAFSLAGLNCSPGQDMQPKSLLPPESIRPSITNDVPLITWRPAARGTTPLHEVLLSSLGSAEATSDDLLQRMSCDSPSPQHVEMHNAFLVDL